MGNAVGWGKEFYEEKSIVLANIYRVSQETFGSLAEMEMKEWDRRYHWIGK